MNKDEVIGALFFFSVFLFIPLFLGAYLDAVYEFPHIITAFISIVGGLIIVGVCSR